MSRKRGFVENEVLCRGREIEKMREREVIDKKIQYRKVFVSSRRPFVEGSGLGHVLSISLTEEKYEGEEKEKKGARAREREKKRFTGFPFFLF